MKLGDQILSLFDRIRNFDLLLQSKILFGILSVFGLIFHYLDVTRGGVLLLTEVYLIFMIGLILFFDVSLKKKSIIQWLLATFLITFILEMIGTKTGLIFGSYTYSDVWLLQINGTPLIIGLLWVFVVLSGATIANLTVSYLKRLEHFLWVNGVELTKNLISTADTNSFGWIIIKSLISAASAVILDIFLEPVAIKLDYWQWRGDIVPLQNYVAWFVIAFISTVFLYRCRPKFKLRSYQSFSLYAYLITIIFYIFVLLFVR